MSLRSSILSLSILLLAACAGVSAPLPDTVESKRVVLKIAKHQVVEVAFSTAKAGKVGQLMNDYFPKAMPLAAEYGGSLLASFRVEQAAGSIQAQAGALFVWPSVDAFQRISKDPRLLALMPIRNDALAYINEANFFTIDADTEVVLDPARSYELIEIAAVERQGGGDLLILRPTGEGVGSFRPVGLVLRESGEDLATATDTVRLRIRFNLQRR